jgi:hypothetical protein
MLVTNLPFYPQVKNKPCVHWAYVFIFLFSTVTNRESEVKNGTCINNIAQGLHHPFLKSFLAHKEIPSVLWPTVQNNHKSQFFGNF